ncbi:hypothetical protein CAter282_1367 [Collimonas arenae]|uniref:Uncharacterized protein n=2 Tax=Collimonas arenae TaxID=279058 RepID=A0A127PN97_9BURK|nr:hypothetical protein CAter10_1472 [Collimonas arenae]AMP09158.1 hypothetical protein CAter282_1367 [Collimonas arenae]
MHTPNGDSTSVLPNVLRVQVESVAEVEAHEIEQIGDRTEHVLTFRGGGLLGCTLIKRRRTIEVVMHNLGFEFDHQQGHLNVQSTLGIAPLRLQRAMCASCICDIMAHNIYKAFGTTTHVLQFCDGHDAEYAYNDRGEFINQSCEMTRRPPIDRDGNSPIRLFCGKKI